MKMQNQPIVNSNNTKLDCVNPINNKNQLLIVNGIFLFFDNKYDNPNKLSKIPQINTDGFASPLPAQIIHLCSFFHS